jgi:hypothetical protein
MQPPDSIIVKVVQEPVKSTTIVDVVMGTVLGATLIGIKLFRARYNLEPVPDSEALRITPQ